MRIRLGVPDVLSDGERKEALDAALESVTHCAEGLVRRRIVPTAHKAIKAGRVKWRPEPPGDEHFDLPNVVLARGHGDCDDLAPWAAGSLRATGVDPHARAIVRKSGPTRWHAVVRRGDGSIDDPSAWAGMYEYKSRHGVSGVSGGEVVGAGPSIVRPMADGKMCLAICPSKDPRHPRVWFCRLDVPDVAEPWAWSGMSASPNPSSAIVRSIQAVRHVAGDELDGIDDARLACLHDILHGADPEEVADALENLAGGDVDVEGCVTDAINTVGFLDSITKAVSKPFRKITKPFAGLAKGAMPFFAGFGGPQAAVLQAFGKGDPFSAFGALRGAQTPGGFGGDQRPAFERAKEFFAQNPLGPTALPFANAVLPTMFPGMGSLFMGLATPQGMAPGAQPQQQSAEQWAPPTFGMEPGVVAQPWGAEGPAVMRF